jgi:hypothetical protein
MMTVAATTMRRSGVFVTAFATLSSSSTTTKRGTAILATRAATTFVPSTPHTIMSTALHHQRTAFRPISNRLLDTMAQRRCQSALASTATTMEQSSTLNAELQAKMDVTHPAYEVLQKDVVTEYL